jgi:CheY-like chemotaxis protein
MSSRARIVEILTLDFLTGALKGKHVKLVAQTGWGQREDRRRTREAGFDAHLAKPVDIASLQQLL